MVDLPNGPILPSMHIFPQTIPLELDSSSQDATINETFQNLKCKSINSLTLSKTEPNSMEVCDKEDPSNIHHECHKKTLGKPSPTIQEEISWKE